MYNINFFGRAGDLYQRTRKKDQKFLMWSLVGFSVALTIFVSVIGINLWLGQKLNGIISKQNQTKQALVDNQPLEVAYLVFSSKLQAIAEIFEQRNNKQQAINYLSNLFGDQVFINGVNYDGEAQVLSLNLTSANIFDLEKLINGLNTQEVKSNFSSLTKSNIKRNEDGSYNLKLTLELKQNQAEPAKPVVLPNS
jgi:Tfp pilus assembly protein PilN